VINWRTICVFLAVLLPMLPGMGKVNGAEVKVELPASAAVLTNAVLQKVEYPKSEFSIEPGYGRDPFFPASTRRTAVAEPPVETSPPPAAIAPPKKEPSAMANTFDPAKVVQPAADNDLAFLSVKGIIATTSSRVITLHTSVRSYIFRTGDAMSVRVPDGRMRVRCLEIRGRSGVFQIDGHSEPIELQLSEK
jgi:hypothetical protein